MDLEIKKTDELSGNVNPSPSKFYTQFSTAISLLAEGKSVIKSPLVADDTRCLIKAIETMGATTKRSRKKWSIWGEGPTPYPTGQVLDAKKSITSLSLLTSLSALTSRVMVVTGKSQIRSIPVPSLIKALQNLGVDVHSTKSNDSPPLIIFESEIKGGKIELDKDMDPRSIPALLILTPFAEEETQIDLTPDIKSPATEMALELMKKSGIDIENEENKLKISPGEYEPIEVQTPPDIFSTFPYVVGAVLTKSEIEISEIEKSPRVEDFTALLRRIGIKIREDGKSLRIEPPENIKGGEYSLEEYPELLPFAAVIASTAEGKTTITDSEKARYMKSDRISAITEGLQRMSVDIEENETGVTVKGPAKLKGNTVNGYEDDAIVAALATAGLVAKGKNVVKNRAETLRESYPNFVSAFRNLGADMSYSS